MSVIVFALTAAIDPYRQTRQFHHALRCEQTGGTCFTQESVSISERRTYETTSTTTGSDGTTSTTRTTHYELTWQRGDGSRQSHEVSWDLYDRSRAGLPASLQVWRGQVVGITVDGRTDTFSPSETDLLGLWLWLAFIGLGIALWGLLGWWDGWFFLYYRAFAWSFVGFVPFCFLVPGVLSYGAEFSVEFLVTVVFAGFFTVVGAILLAGSLSFRDRWWPYHRNRKLIRRYIRRPGIGGG
ncbi:hypothetical protein ACWF9G_07250 [Nocardia sp. NPDC055029]